ncbi:FecR domain-containing protein [Pseudomonas sp. LRF_L74]|uniref:FecR domain-containing protein n=1 Tax=Pseudomonas sp. LRF_L74 TaxID=3369422 RepID=UPI003F627A8B
MLNDDSRGAIRSAARWLALIESGQASEADRAGLQRWREADARHEQAWQKALALKSRFGGLPPELAMASLDRPQQDRRRLLKGLLGLAAATPALWLASRELPIDAWRADVSTATGERRRISLGDGSVLELNTASAVNLDIERRRLSLVRGEIALRLPGDTPFAIETAQVLAVVNSGEVCIRQDADSCEFSVFRGSIELRTPARILQLHAGQRARLQRGQVVETLAFDPLAPGWREGVIMANGQALGDFLRELDRYRPGILRWAPELENLRVTGSFRLDDTDQILSLLAASLPLEVRYRTRYWVSLVPRAKVA